METEALRFQASASSSVLVIRLTLLDPTPEARRLPESPASLHARVLKGVVLKNVETGLGLLGGRGKRGRERGHGG